MTLTLYTGDIGAAPHPPPAGAPARHYLYPPPPSPHLYPLPLHVALPIFQVLVHQRPPLASAQGQRRPAREPLHLHCARVQQPRRSEERRVGKECRSRSSPDH